MPDSKLVVDCSPPTPEEAHAVANGLMAPDELRESRIAVEPLTAAEQAEIDVFRAASVADEAVRERRRQAIDGARPGAAIRQKLRDGTGLTAAEIQAAVRWLLLRELREVLD